MKRIEWELVIGGFVFIIILAVAFSTTECMRVEKEAYIQDEAPVKKKACYYDAYFECYGCEWENRHGTNWICED